MLFSPSESIFFCQGTCTFSFRILTSNAVKAREEISRCAFRPQFLARDSQSYAIRKIASCSLSKAEVRPKTPRIKNFVCRWKFTYSERIENHIGILIGESFLNSCQAVPSSMSMQNSLFCQPGVALFCRAVFMSASACNDLRVVSGAVDFFADSEDDVPVL